MACLWLLALLSLLLPAGAQFNSSGGQVFNGRATNYGPTGVLPEAWLAPRSG